MHAQDLPAFLERAYGITATSIEQHVGGSEADAFVVDGSWFVKAWRFGPPTTLGLLDELRQRGLPVVPPVRTIDGRLTTPAFAVYPFLRGRPAPENPTLLGRTLSQVHAIADVDLPPATMDEWCVEFLRTHLDHPWIAGRRNELVLATDRLEAVIDLARRAETPHVLVHNDLFGENILVGDNGDIIAILDWDHACLAPREHDLWVLVDEERSPGLLAAYGVRDLSATHLEYALLARSLRDLASRVKDEVDRPGVEKWGFGRLRRIDEVLSDFS